MKWTELIRSYGDGKALLKYKSVCRPKCRPELRKVRSKNSKFRFVRLAYFPFYFATCKLTKNRLKYTRQNAMNKMSISSVRNLAMVRECDFKIMMLLFGH